MSSFLKFMQYTAVASGIVLAMNPVIAQAGFDWTPPPRVQKPVVAQPETAPQDPAVSGPLTPEPDAVMAAPVPVAPVTPVTVTNMDVAPVPPVEPPVGMKTIPAPAEQAVPVPASAPVADTVSEPPVTLHAKMPEEKPVEQPVVESKIIQQPAPVAASVVPAFSPAPTSDVVEGFGKDIPLALALRDIVPSSYAYSFGQGEYAGRKISWRGGKPWLQVLNDALVPLNLVAAVQGNAVTITSPTMPSVQAEAPVKAEPAPVPLTMTAPEPTVSSVPVTTSKFPVVDLTVKRTWNAQPGSTLRTVLEQWSKDANVELNWSTAYDYPVNNAFYFEGTYGEAVDSLLSSYGGEHPAPKGRLYPNLPDGPSVLMIN